MNGNDPWIDELKTLDRDMASRHTHSTTVDSRSLTHQVQQRLRARQQMASRTFRAGMVAACVLVVAVVWPPVSRQAHRTEIAKRTLPDTQRPKPKPEATIPLTDWHSEITALETETARLQRRQKQLALKQYRYVQAELARTLNTTDLQIQF